MEKKLRRITAYIDDALTRKETILIAIDGKCTSGKTTMAARLAELYDCNVFHMDDFFLRPQQRTPERFAQPGGNVDYERFLEEVLLPLKSGNNFSYRPFDCKTFTLSEPVSVSAKKVNIIEGSYSMHPYFGEPYDVKILLTVTEDMQRARVLNRPAAVQERFFTQWLPMENRYLETYADRLHPDLVL